MTSADALAVCVECGGPISYHYAAEHAARLRSGSVCFTCDFWREKVELGTADPMRVVRVDGVHYHVGDEKPAGYRGFLGYGGREFRIKFHDGRLVTTRNLWCQGAIPAHFRARLPDNATFLDEAGVTTGNPGAPS